MNNIEEKKGSSGTVDVTEVRPSSSDITTRSYVKLHANTVQDGVELIKCCHNTEKNGANAEENSDMTDRENKRFKRSDMLDSPITDTQRRSNSMDQTELELAKSFCFKSIGEENMSSKDDGVSGEAAESGSLDESLICCLEKDESDSANDWRLVIHNANGTSNDAKSEEEDKSKFLSKRNSSLHGEEYSMDESTNAALEAVSKNSAKRKLLVLDVNGLLVSICSYVPYDYDPDDIILRKAVFKRPYCDDFLRFCFEKFNVGIWTSKTKRNMEPVIDFLFGNDRQKLLFCWDQSHCTETGFATVENKHKPLLLKKLKKLWEKYDPDIPWEKGDYNETNTLLLDDSPYKALCNPQYTAVFPDTYHFRRMSDYSLGPGGDLRVYLEGLAMAENVQEYVKQNPFGQRPITERNLSWLYYLRVIEASTTPPRHTDDES